MNEIRTAVVGLGTRSLNWISILQRIGGYRIVAICDPILPFHDRAKARLTEPGGVRTFIRYEDVLADPGVDAIALTVRCEEQGEMAARGLEAGKHVHMEVPGAHRMEDCWRIVSAQERSGRVFQLAEQVRYAGFVEAWKNLVAEGRLGRITFCEGQYFHYYTGKSFLDPATGRFYAPEEVAAHPEARPAWLQRMPPIHYLPHDLGPLLKVLDDRVTEVVGMSTASPSAAHPELASPDIQVALMKTAKGAILRMAASFAQPHPHVNNHWLHVLGTKGSVELRRSNRDFSKLWLADGQMHDKSDVDWRFERTDAPAEARGSGHNDMDYYVHAAFRDAVLKGRALEYEVYRAMDTTAPAILAAESIARDGVKLPVPSFRPDAARPLGRMPARS
jgi:predicted dehydrogenase